MPLNLTDRGLRRVARSVLHLPSGLFSPLTGPPKRNLRGDTLDPTVQALLLLEGRFAEPLGDPDPIAARSDFERAVAMGSPEPVLMETTDGTIPGPAGPRPTRTYRPETTEGTLVYFHGGGWAVGSLDSHDAVCRRIAHEGTCTVVSVDYRLAPEHPFPAGLDDALAAFDAIREATTGLVGVAGDSAGGNLSALIAQHRQPDLQLLIYPACDLRRLSDSYAELKDGGYVLTGDAIDRYLDWYGADPKDPLASPLLATPGAARAIVVTAGFDPLRDEGESYAHALRAAGTSTIDLRYSRLVHGFVNMDGLIPAADRAMTEICFTLRHAWASCDTV